ncbi:PREDICTED: NEDD4-binding protein 2-like 2-like, partial [Chrysochloris asiatica]|uniref:NEDD4-binding protein 2-like 2-like n=1 Tax=Chrysochloris asiatica TaxID=185453 RepID=A0A9B0U210_CHRAS
MPAHPPAISPTLSYARPLPERKLASCSPNPPTFFLRPAQLPSLRTTHAASHRPAPSCPRLQNNILPTHQVPLLPASSYERPPESPQPCLVLCSPTHLFAPPTKFLSAPPRHQRILLGQSRDGIVFSTDDYFRHQDGYRYNVNQLGDAHDWNQNRAKQAIAQGRSPVIIDNTNTQAWEMKPYVEMAVGKGYRVEFHEPETWWKFDPEELEKRNKHGVSRKKIVQMLERYESHMSIAVVLNSVEPSHKSALRPPPPECRP